MYDKKIGKFGFLKNGAGIGENAYQVRNGSLINDSYLAESIHAIIKYDFILYMFPYFCMPTRWLAQLCFMRWT